MDVQSVRAGGADIYEKMFAAGRLDDGSSSGYGYGVRVETESGRRRVVASGAWAGSGATLIYYPEQKFGFAVLANWDYTPVQGFAPDIVGIYLPPAAPTGTRPPAPATARASAPVSVSPEALDRYAGEYRLAPGQYATFVHAGSQLVLQMGTQRYPLTALSDADFVLDFAGLRLSFRTSKDGKSEVVWKEGGEEQVAPKIVLVRPTPAELKEYVGSYYNGELDVRFRLDAADSGLAIGPIPPNLRLAPETKDRFFSRQPLVPAIAFQRDAQGRITGFTVDSDALRDLVFRRE